MAVLFALFFSVTLKIGIIQVIIMITQLTLGSKYMLQRPKFRLDGKKILKLPGVYQGN